AGVLTNLEHAADEKERLRRESKRSREALVNELRKLADMTQREFNSRSLVSIDEFRKTALRQLDSTAREIDTVNRTRAEEERKVARGKIQSLERQGREVQRLQTQLAQYEQLVRDFQVESHRELQTAVRSLAHQGT